MYPESKMDHNEKLPERANAIEKALALMLAFLSNNHPMTVTELSRLTGFHKATTSRILATLAESDFLRQEASSRRFYLGETVMKLAAAVRKSLNAGLVALIKPHLDGLNAKTGQTVTLEIPSGKASVMACVVEGPRPIRVAGQVGDRLPWNVAAGLRCILAHRGREAAEQALAQPMPVFTDRTIATREAYLASLEQVRRAGFALEESEFAVGINAMGVPVFDFEDRAVAAICVVGLEAEVNAGREDVLAALKRAAADSSLEFYHRPPA